VKKRGTIVKSHSEFSQIITSAI